MIPSEFIVELAEYVNDTITTVSLNSGAYETSSFVIKEVNDSTLELEYIIPFGAVTEVTLIELKSAVGQVISRNEVSVPVLVDTIIRQAIQVKEG